MRARRDPDDGDVEVRKPGVRIAPREDPGESPPDVAEAGEQQPHRATFAHQRAASSATPASKRSTSARVLYIEIPVRSTPPRSARPSTSIARAA